jgi:hypothetical protein
MLKLKVTGVSDFLVVNACQSLGLCADRWFVIPVISCYLDKHVLQ